MSASVPAAALFLDTEWADDQGRELVSLALVPGGTYGLFTDGDIAPFYAERDPLPAANAFVAQAVYPLLDRGPYAKPDAQFSRELGAYLAQARQGATPAPPVIVATHANDFELLRGMLVAARQAPEYRVELRYSESLLDLIRVAFAADPALARRRHHALVDAQVLCQVYPRWSQIGRRS